MPQWQPPLGFPIPGCARNGISAEGVADAPGDSSRIDQRTYREIAREIGQPTAARAVAGACATNPVAIVIPCHRVVREGGHLAGYRWGVEREKTLLALEQERQDT